MRLVARCEYIDRRENVIALGNSGTGKTHVALGLGLAACQKGLAVGFTTAAALVHELMEAWDEKRLLRLQGQLAKYRLLIIDELGFYLPPDMDTRVVADTSDTMHVVLPTDPSIPLSDEMLTAVAGGKPASSAGCAGSMACSTLPSTASSAGTSIRA
jgi:hypothetical protein